MSSAFSCPDDLPARFRTRFAALVRVSILHTHDAMCARMNVDNMAEHRGVSVSCLRKMDADGWVPRRLDVYLRCVQYCPTEAYQGEQIARYLFGHYLKDIVLWTEAALERLFLEIERDAFKGFGSRSSRK